MLIVSIQLVLKQRRHLSAIVYLAMTESTVKIVTYILLFLSQSNVLLSVQIY